MRLMLKCWFPCIAVGVITIVLLHTVLLIGIVPSSSMEPLIPSGSVILVNRAVYRKNAPAVGDVIVFSRDGTLLVKRVAATEGEVVLHAGVMQRVPNDSVYVLGDNQAASIDSADWENPFVPVGDVIGKLIS